MTFTTSERFDYDDGQRRARRARGALPGLHRRPGRAARSSRPIEYAVEARYPHQIWEIEVPLRRGRFDGADGRRRRWSPTSTPRTTSCSRSAIPAPASSSVTWRARVALPPARRQARAPGGRCAPRSSSMRARQCLLRRPRLGRGRGAPLRGARRGRGDDGPGDRRILVHHRRRRSRRAARRRRPAASRSRPSVMSGRMTAEIARARPRRRADGAARQPARHDRAQDGEHALPHRALGRAQLRPRLLLRDPDRATAAC